MHTYIQTDRQPASQTDRHTDIHTYRQTYRQTDRHTYIYIHTYTMYIVVGASVGESCVFEI